MVTRAVFLLFGLLISWPLVCAGFDEAATTDFSISQNTKYCLDCHDGAAAAAVQHSHAVDTDYVLAQARSNGKLKPIALLDPAIYLKSGQLICVSCHHPDSKNEAKLVLTNAGSILCLACHNL